MSTWRENMPWNCERKTWTPIRSGWGHRLVRVKAQHFSWCIVFIWLKTTQQSAGLMFKPKIQLCSITGNHLNVCFLQKQRKTTKSHCVSTQISNLNVHSNWMAGDFSSKNLDHRFVRVLIGPAIPPVFIECLFTSIQRNQISLSEHYQTQLKAQQFAGRCSSWKSAEILTGNHSIHRVSIQNSI